MKSSKKIILILLGAALLGCVIGTVCIGLGVAPTVNHALRISELLQPVIEAQNQTMHISISANVDENPISLNSDVYMVTEDHIQYLALEQNGIVLYVADNILLLENGKAFKLGEKMQAQTVSALLPQIGALYDFLKITAEETETETVYSVTVTGEQVGTLLSAISPGESLPVDCIQKLDLSLTERNGKLEQIHFAGGGELDGMAIALDVIISGFRILATGDYPIPETVKQSAATVDPDALFSLTEDLYRLVPAVVSLGNMESMDGTLELSVDCGLIQLDTEMKLSDLKSSATGQLDAQQLQALPELLGWLCVEGDISCEQKGNAYVYALKLDAAAMKQLVRMILPDLAQYGDSLTEGIVEIRLEAAAIHSMEVAIEGKISAVLVKIPMSVRARFSFD